MNVCSFIGNFTKEPEYAETKNGTASCRFTIAVNSTFKGADGERKTSFINCQAWRGSAETIYKYCKKGDKIAITGELSIDNYEKDGQKRQAVTVTVNSFDFLNSRKDAEEGTEPQKTTGKKGGGKKVSNAFDDDDDMPF